MKKIYISLFLLALVNNIAFGQTSASSQHYYWTKLYSFRISSPVYAGEYFPVSAKFGVGPIGNPPDTIQFHFVHNAPLTPPEKIINIIGMGHITYVQKKYLLFYVKYPQPGTYFPYFQCPDSQWKTSSEVTVLPNPDPLPPVIYKIPDQSFDQGEVVSILLSKYVTDANGDSITWSATSSDKNLKVVIDGQTAVLSSPYGEGKDTVTFWANDGHFNTKTTIKVNVIAPPEKKAFVVTGHIFDIFTNDTLPGAKVTINDQNTIRQAFADKNGNFTITVHTTGIPASTNYFPVTITVEGYTPRHTWVDVTKSTKDLKFSLIPADFNWKLYDHTMRGNLDGLISDGKATIHWAIEQPEIVILNVDSVDQEVQDVVWNIKNRLVKFNPVNTNPDSIKVIKTHPTDWTWRKHKMGVEWDPNGPLGAYVMDSEFGFIFQDAAIFNCAAGAPNKESAVYNQELGSCMGATNEPNYPGAEYQSVFAGFTNLITYSDDDYKMGKVYTRRSLLHYLKTGVEGLNGEDWEVRPDIVAKKLAYAKFVDQLGYKSAGTNIKRTLRLFFKGGTSKTWHFAINKVPQDLIKTVSLDYMKTLVKYGFLPKEALQEKEAAVKK